MHRPQLVTWTTHTAENTTLLDYRKLYTYMWNIVTEFYLYSIVYIYLINSRLDVTFSVRHHFRMKLYQYQKSRLSKCQSFDPEVTYSSHYITITGEKNGEVVASAIRIPWGNGVYFGSYYYVAEAQRKNGYGTRLRDQVHSYILQLSRTLCTKSILCLFS